MSLTPEQRQRLIQQYADGPGRLTSALAKVPEDARPWSPGPGKWSVHEVICHCADSETNAAARIRYLVAENHATIQGYDQDAWALRLDYRNHPLDAALALVRAARANTVPLLRRLPQEAWSRQGVHTESGPYSAENWLQTYADHLEVHARQIERSLAAWQAESTL